MQCEALGCGKWRLLEPSIRQCRILIYRHTCVSKFVYNNRRIVNNLREERTRSKLERPPLLRGR